MDAGTTGFTDATSVSRAGEGRYDVSVDAGWSIGGTPHGGYLMALVARAAVDASPHPDPLTVSTHFMRPPSFGTAAVEVEPLRVGRSVATHRARLVESGEPVLEMTVTTGHLPDESPTWSADPPELPDVESCVTGRRRGPGGVEVAIMDHVDVRFDPATIGWATGEPGPQPPEVRGWIRLRSEPTDVFTIILAADVMPPTVFALGLFGWAPTVEMTTLVRARPRTGWLRVSVSTVLVRGRWFEEDVTLWDEDGALVGQGRQLALVGRARR